MPPRFDPETLPLPHKLEPLRFEASQGILTRWAGGLGRPALAGADVLPPFPFTGCTIQLMARNFDIAGGVYWREQVTYHRPVRVGETLTVEGSVDATYVHDGRLYAVMSSRTAGDDGSPVATSRSTGLQQYRRREDIAGSEEGGPPAGAPEPDDRAAAANPAAGAVSRLQPGAVFSIEPITVTLEMMRAQAGDDNSNPIHTDEEVARRAGLRAPIAGGPHVLAFAELALLDGLGSEVLSHGGHVDVRWVSPLYAGGTISAKAVLSEISRGRAVFTLEAVADGSVAMTGTATIPFPETRS